MHKLYYCIAYISSTKLVNSLTEFLGLFLGLRQTSGHVISETLHSPNRFAKQSNWRRQLSTFNGPTNAYPVSVKHFCQTVFSNYTVWGQFAQLFYRLKIFVVIFVHFFCLYVTLFICIIPSNL